MNYWAIIVAAVASLVVGAVWNSPFLFGKERMKLAGMDSGADRKVPVGKMLVEFVRGLVVAYVLAHFVVLLGAADWMSAVRLGIWLWIGFQAALLVGAVIWEKQPWKLYAIHAGDALLHILVMAIILGVWR